MYYILYEGLKIESNEPVYCTPNKPHKYNIPYVHNISCKYNTLNIY